MKKITLIPALLCLLVVLALGSTANARIVAMSDSELAEITGQAGFATIGKYAGFQRDLFSNGLQFGASAATAGLLQATIEEHTGNVSAIRVADDGSSYSFDIENPGFTAENYRTSLLLGNPTGTGNSLGTISMEYIRVTTHGTVRVTVR